MTLSYPHPLALKRQASCLSGSSAQAPSFLSFTRRCDAFGRRAVEVIICMITRDFSVISIDVTGVSLSLSVTGVSLSLSTTHKSHSRTIIRKRFRVSYNKKKRTLLDERTTAQQIKTGHSINGFPLAGHAPSFPVNRSAFFLKKSAP